MQANFEGRLFKGKLFAGRLFHSPERRIARDVIPYGSGRMVYPKKKPTRRDNDDDVLLFLLRR